MLWSREHILVQGQPVPGKSQGACDLPTVGTSTRQVIGQYLHPGKISLHTRRGGTSERACAAARLSDLSQILSAIQDRTEEFILTQC